MFDKRLTGLCPESKKYIAGNIILQWLELICNAAMIRLIAGSLDRLYAVHKPLFWWDTLLCMFGLLILIRFFYCKRSNENELSCVQNGQAETP